ncbi:MAG TPA: hypothetical protein VGQ57_09380 [Polyangiaceae bacterium]|nr:hypothetical protein [Polyangiaceae bacterium]
MQNSKGRTASSKTARVEGEGSYGATRDYNKNLRRALTDSKGIARGAEAARKAVEGPEGAELRAAEQKGKAGPRVSAKPGR